MACYIAYPGDAQIPGVEALCRVFCAAAPNACGSSVWKLLYFILLAPRILRGLLHFWKVCAYRIVSGGSSVKQLIYCLKSHSRKSNLLQPTDTQFYKGQKKRDRSLIDQNLHVMFLRKFKKQYFFVDTAF